MHDHPRGCGGLQRDEQLLTLQSNCDALVLRCGQRDHQVVAVRVAVIGLDVEILLDADSQADGVRTGYRWRVLCVHARNSDGDDSLFAGTSLRINGLIRELVDPRKTGRFVLQRRQICRTGGVADLRHVLPERRDAQRVALRVDVVGQHVDRDRLADAGERRVVSRDRGPIRTAWREQLDGDGRR